MQLRDIRDNTVMQIICETGETVYRATFQDLYTNESFFARGKELHFDAEKMRPGTKFQISFYCDVSICTFSGALERVWIKNGAYLTLLKQLSRIEETNQRQYQRETMSVQVILYRLSEEEFRASRFDRELGKIEFKSTSFDIGEGGLCLVSNDSMRPATEPYYLAEFMIGKDLFLLPARVARRGDAQQMARYRHDYGLQFLYDHLPNERRRLLDALVYAKVAAVRR